MDEQREAFEAWIKATYPFGVLYRWPNDGGYTEDRVEWAWRGWQAHAAQEQA